MRRAHVNFQKADFYSLILLKLSEKEDILFVKIDIIVWLPRFQPMYKLLYLDCVNKFDEKKSGSSFLES